MMLVIDACVSSFLCLAFAAPYCVNCKVIYKQFLKGFFGKQRFHMVDFRLCSFRCRHIVRFLPCDLIEFFL